MRFAVAYSAKAVVLRPCSIVYVLDERRQLDSLIFREKLEQPSSQFATHRELPSVSSETFSKACADCFGAPELASQAEVRELVPCQS